MARHIENQEIPELTNLSRSTWYQLARDGFSPGRREPCRVCGRYGSLAHAHHLIPLSVQWAERRLRVDQRHAWLCPTHHSAVHVLIAHRREMWSQTLSPARMAAILELSEDNAELIAVNDLAGEAFA